MYRSQFLLITLLATIALVGCTVVATPTSSPTPTPTATPEPTATNTPTPSPTPTPTATLEPTATNTPTPLPTPTPAATVPHSPSNVTASAGSGVAEVKWDAPASDGGSPITGYTVTSDPGGLTTSVDTTALSALVFDLTNGTTYTFIVTATNAVGTSGASASFNAVTPTSGTTGGGGGGGTTPTPAAVSAAMENDFFSPGSISINVGDTITWSNSSGTPHTTTDGVRTNLGAAGGIWDQTVSSGSSSTAVTFSTAGTFQYFCRFHFDMDGTVVVTV